MGSKVSQVSSGFAIVAAYWQSKVQAAQPHSKKLGHSLQLAGSPAPKHRLPTWWENSGCPILWDDYRHGRPPLQHNADTLKRGVFTHRTSLTMAAAARPLNPIFRSNCENRFYLCQVTIGVKRLQKTHYKVEQLEPFSSRAVIQWHIPALHEVQTCNMTIASPQKHNCLLKLDLSACLRDTTP